MAERIRPISAGDGVCSPDHPLEWANQADTVASISVRIPPMMPSPDDPADLELPPDRMRAMGEAVLARLVDHIAALQDQPACGDVRAEALCRAMREPPPQYGTALEGLLDPLFRDWIPGRSTRLRPAIWPISPAAGSSRRRWPT
jgi:hypothetical protein